MSLESNRELEDELLPEYEFSKMKGGVRGKYVKQYREGTNVVLLDPDVQAVFPTSEAVNAALRKLMQITQKQQ